MSVFFAEASRRFQGWPVIGSVSPGTCEFRLTGLLPVLAIVYLILGSIHLHATAAGAGRVSGYAAHLAGVFFLGAWMVIRRNGLTPARLDPVICFLSALALFHGLWNFSPSNPSGPAISIFLVLALSGATLRNQTWQGAVIGVSMAGWFAAAGRVMRPEALAYWSAVLITTALLSFVHMRYRLWKDGKMAESAVPKNPDEQFHRKFMERAVAGTEDGLWYWDLKTDVFHFSSAWEALLGFAPGELTATPAEWMSRVHPGYSARLRSELTAHLYGSTPQFRSEHRIRRKDGTYAWVLARGAAIRDEEGDPVVLAGSHSDITPLIEVEKRLLTDAFTDELTGLPNRNALMGHLQSAADDKIRMATSAPLFAVAFLDLDRFKIINDTLGHNVGDQLLAAVAGRLRKCTRPDDVVARFGGDEFVILMRGLQNEEVAVEIGNRVLKSLAEPFHLGENTVPSGGSIGIAFSSEDFADCDDLLRFGDLAMYRAKALRNGQVQVFEKGMLDHSQEQEALQTDLGLALERGQMVMHYQPFVVIGTGAVAGIEALVRWERSPGKLLYPGDFLPLAEKAGHIQAIGEWVLRTACAQNAAWQRAGLPPVRIAVNLSASQLQKKDLPERVSQILRETNLEPRWLELEVTESALMASLSVIPATLKSLSDSGVRTSIDHFGSGNSSLLYLRQYNFQTVKMDRSFLSGVTVDSRAAAVAKGLITLAHSLGLCVVAEGVESDEQLQFLAAEGCEHAQGYLTGRPATGGEMGARLRSWQKQAAPSASPRVVEQDLARLSAAHLPAASPGTGAVRWALERKARV